MQYIPTVIQAVAGNDYKVYVYFDDGKITVLDMRSNLNKGVFRSLADQTVFRKSLTIMNGTVAWDLTGKHDPADCIDIDPVMVYEMPTVSENEFINFVI
jgi:hypothetical protein